jgi:hypothetical protein
MKRYNLTTIYWMTVIAAVLLALSGCGTRTMPEGASTISGSLLVPEGTGGRFSILRWPNGLNIILVDDIVSGDYEGSASGNGSTEDPTWRGEGWTRAADGREFYWRVETTDGKTTAFFINDQAYALEQGTMFLIRVTPGSTQVVQHKDVPAGRCFDYDSCEQLLKNDPAIKQFIQETLQAHKGD